MEVFLIGINVSTGFDVSYLLAIYKDVCPWWASSSTLKEHGWWAISFPDYGMCVRRIPAVPEPATICYGKLLRFVWMLFQMGTHLAC